MISPHEYIWPQPLLLPLLWTQCIFSGIPKIGAEKMKECGQHGNGSESESESLRGWNCSSTPSVFVCDNIVSLSLCYRGLSKGLRLHQVLGPGDWKPRHASGYSPWLWWSLSLYTSCLEINILYKWLAFCGNVALLHNLSLHTRFTGQATVVILLTGQKESCLKGMKCVCEEHSC